MTIRLILLCFGLFLTTAVHAQAPKTVDDLKWDLSTAPFDVKALLSVPPPEQNGADLAIDAIAEFSVETVDLLPKNEQAARRQTVKARQEQYRILSDILLMNPAKVDGVILDHFVEQHAEGFKKLAAAQRKPRTVFVTGIGISVRLSHAQGARQIARVAEFKCVRHLERGEIDAALDTLATVLRLSQDLQPRGFFVNQLVSYAIESIACETMVKRILAAPKLTAAHCARLAKLLDKQHEHTKSKSVIGMKMEYVTIRTAIDGIQHRRGEYAPKFLRDLLNLDGERSYGELVAELIDSTDKNAARRINAMKPADFKLETNLLNTFIKRVIDTHPLPYAKRRKLLNAIAQELRDKNKTVITALLFPAFDQFDEAHTRSLTRLNGYLALTAARHWQLTSKEPLPDDIHKVATAAGLKHAPADHYSDGQPIQLIVQNGKPVAYSIGKDGIDQEAAADWKYGQQPGDFIFRIAKDVHIHAEN